MSFNAKEKPVRSTAPALGSSVKLGVSVRSNGAPRCLRPNAICFTAKVPFDVILPDFARGSVTSRSAETWAVASATGASAGT